MPCSCPTTTSRPADSAVLDLGYYDPHFPPGHATILRHGLPGIRNGEQVKIGELGLIGEVIALDGENALVQTYESTEGIRPGERVEGLGWPLSVELGPGLLGAIFDGVQRPLEEIFLKAGDHIPRGMNISELDREKS